MRRKLNLIKLCLSILLPVIIFGFLLVIRIFTKEGFERFGYFLKSQLHISEEIIALFIGSLSIIVVIVAYKLHKK